MKQKKITLLLLPLALTGCQLTQPPVAIEKPEPKALPKEDRGIEELCDVRDSGIVTKHAMKELNFDLVVSYVSPRNVVYAYSLSQAKYDADMKASDFIVGYHSQYDYRTAIFDMPKGVTLQKNDMINLTGVDKYTHYSGCKFEISNEWPIKVVKTGVFKYVPKD